MRSYSLTRNTQETQIELSLNLDGAGQADVATGIGFLDHMLTLLAFHGNFDLTVKANGDLWVDSHHTTEDIGIALGQAITAALGDKKGINRYGSFTIPMDEALVTTDLDISGRPFIHFNAQLANEKLGAFDTEMTEEFFRAVAFNAGITLHINEHYGKNTHHIIEACFKSFGRALRRAVAIDAANADKVMSSKGLL